MRSSKRPVASGKQHAITKQAPSTEQQAASSKQAPSTKHQASSKQQAASSKQQLVPAARSPAWRRVPGVFSRVRASHRGSCPPRRPRKTTPTPSSPATIDPDQPQKCSTMQSIELTFFPSRRIRRVTANTVPNASNSSANSASSSRDPSIPPTCRHVGAMACRSAGGDRVTKT